MKSEENKLSELQRIPETKLNVVLEEYLKFMSSTKYIRYVLLLFGALVLLYNVFIAGKSYSYSDYNTIKTSVILICCIFIIVLLVFAGVYFTKQLKVKGKLKEIAEYNNLDFKKVRKEFNIYVKEALGGYPI
ncbi:hypothetical protein [Cellulophaga lytica]|uniref:Uncharacterized protein n=1 Tax=Cellulophaga lytica (strain ATCC 23178 / DSM 7489 / JCM 8516 / NBRC 14961 / NCIMB 1423 / VKM B-1433 / Cy l20) TaxID=867900 RepID=F0REE8_CELLC|nr:hypothetical protein [Cellulophaga lytica]ADY29923.1 hypothetical protein Celly_2102 [Cellulophaga lytica DSM 7489]AIM60923.1 hypothetical protein IX49_10445 [Cellulophaga lytica]APU10791.1 hypothetical protein A5M85_11020 [Cellulophaga lytica]MDO6853409.1 hypothetical protein [Cellulophaga lytica]WQG75913.1 hypothetical protein SR888_09445 [Cellulophaga lytica]